MPAKKAPSPVNLLPIGTRVLLRRHLNYAGHIVSGFSFDGKEFYDILWDDGKWSMSMRDGFYVSLVGKLRELSSGSSKGLSKI
jgi:hypothetical protein